LKVPPLPMPLPLLLLMALSMSNPPVVVGDAVVPMALSMSVSGYYALTCNYPNVSQAQKIVLKINFRLGR
jgi:hypothetical protein